MGRLLYHQPLRAGRTTYTPGASPASEAARKRLHRIRVTHGKSARALVSVAEYCAATGLPEAEARAAPRP